MKNNTYSIFIFWAKITLPLLALALLSTVFLLARPIDPGNAIPFAKVNVEELAREKGITAPNYSGITRDGTTISISANSAKPQPNGDRSTITTEGFNAEFELPEGAIVTLESETGVINTDTQSARLEGNVRVVSSVGYVVRSEQVDASISDARFSSTVPISAVGPGGKITAGSMELVRRNENYLLVFKDGVKLIYDPKG
ncbi:MULTISPECIES: LPS export ABC transporter periplasmic protein LptC [Falsihalocynthiibacter]|uniref:LPS export ABC transporter periplasmic protein LptC n=1 Tax=Falsihalocynthiibacter TaxID=2854182 RepID=UPI0030018EF1